jgi:hypothetical protein
VWSEAWKFINDAQKFMRRHWAALTPWVLAVIAANWVGDLASVAIKADQGAKVFKAGPITTIGAARVFGWAAGSAVQTGQGINPPWDLIPAMTNPFLLLGIVNIVEIVIAIVSAILINNYLLRAARPLKSKKWLMGAPSAVLVLTAALLWFRLYGPILDMVAMLTGHMLPEYTIFIWQVLAWFVFVPFMFTAYLMILQRLQTRSAAEASLRLFKENLRSAWPLFFIGFAFFFVQAAVMRLVPGLSPVLAAGLALVGTLVRVGLGFWLATAWLLWADAKYALLPRPSRS